MPEYQGLSIRLSDGTTYWHSKVGSENEVIKHANRYCRHESDLIIYDVKFSSSNKKINCKFLKHLPYEKWKEDAWSIGSLVSLEKRIKRKT